MTTEDAKIVPIAGRAYSRRRLLRGAALAGTGAAGLALIGVVPGMAHSMDTHAGQDEIHDTMRKLWEDHIVWTRCFIVSFAAGLPNLDATTNRLLANQVDIGNAFKSFFGDDAGNQLASLLTDHILGAAKLLAAAKAGDTAGVKSASDAWYANGNQIAAFLSKLDPHDWPLADMQAMMRQHLDLTLAEGTAELGGDWIGSVAAYDQVTLEILQMADMLAAGLSKRGHH
jgi:hypothetical protein